MFVDFICVKNIFILMKNGGNSLPKTKKRTKTIIFLLWSWELVKKLRPITTF